MKKNNSLSYLALGIVFALFNIIAFVVPTDKTATFWTAYAFSVVAFALQIPLWKLALANKETLKSKFLGIPVLQVGLGYLVVQLITFTIFAIFPTLPTWLAIIVCAVILSFSALSTIGGCAGANKIKQVDEKLEAKRSFILFIHADIEMLSENESDAETKSILKKLAETVRFSDPMSHEMLSGLEAKISYKVEEMKTAPEKKFLATEIEALLTERNKKCKILK